MRAWDWLEERTGIGSLLRRALDEEVEGGARWAYVLGSSLVALFLLEAVTGVLMLATYTPSVTGAWSSVYYIQHEVTAGWFVRGLHHYGSEAMVIVLGLYLLQVLVYGAYKKPREVYWWVVLGLFAMVQAAALTGFVLPWDQSGYWASSVRTHIAGSMPVVGPYIQRLVVGGSSYGQSTLTRFFALHVGVVPPLMVLLLVAHSGLRAKLGLAFGAKRDAPHRASEPYFPGQMARDVVFVVAVLAAVALVTVVAHGAPLSAPVDTARFYPARPEWFHRFLNKLIILLPPALELVATAVLPGIATVFLFALPFLDRGDSRRIKDRLPWLAPAGVGGLGIVWLTVSSFSDDAADEKYQHAVAEAQARAERSVVLASQGIPPGGPLEMLRNDPLTHGADLFAQHCTSCHVLNGEGEREAPDHTGFASRQWMLGLLHEPDGEHYFGPTEIDDMDSMSDLGDEKLEAVTEFMFSLGHEEGDPPYDAELAEAGSEVFEGKCMDCHMLGDDGDYLGMEGPNLTGYGSLRWLRDQIATPDAETQYGSLNEMPSYEDQLSAHDIEMVARFLRLQRFETPSWKVNRPRHVSADKAAKGDGE